MAHISVRNLSLSYPIYGGPRSLKASVLRLTTGGVIANSGGHVNVDALKNISFDLQEGDCLGLMGHNGAGKSTLLRVLAKIYEPVVGHLDVHGSISAMLDLGAGIEQEASGYENIKIRHRVLGLKKSELKKIIADVTEFSELGSFLSLPVRTYSAGMRIRLAFGLATLTLADILLIDEVIGVGDAQFMQKAQERMKHHIKHSSVTVVSSHSTEILKQFCNKGMWLEHGQIKAFGPLQEVLSVYEQSIT